MDELLDGGFLASQCQGHNSTDMHVWSVDVHVQFELLADCLDVLEAFLEIGTRAANPYLNFVLDEGWGKLSEGTNDTFESRRDLATHLVYDTVHEV